MKRLWAPWRLEYIKSPKEKGCVLCKAGSSRPGDGLLLYRGSHSLVVLNKYPYNNGHLMVAPLRHVADIESLTGEESADIFRLMAHSTRILSESMAPGGFNIGMNLGKAAGAGIDDHLHVHVVPRWRGDDNFMPVLADTKVMPEHLSDTLSRLLPRYESVD